MSSLIGNRVRIAAGLLATGCIVRQWNEWLNSVHEHEEEKECENGSSALVASCRPQRPGQIARGVLSCLGYLAAVDMILARRMRDDTSRYFLLHTLANAVITMSTAKEMLQVLSDPVGSSLGRCNVLPTYMVPCLFTYHLSVFSNVPRDEWEHHLLFGLGLAGPQLRYCVGPVQNAIAFFICGLPGGLDYAMLCAVKEGWLRSSSEKIWNSKLQVWMRAPGILLSSYAIYLISRYSGLKQPSKLLPYLLFLLASFNGQYYMQKVVANTAFKHNGQGAAC